MRRAAVLFALAAWVGCGDALVDERYRGEPIFKAKGTIDAQAAASSFVDGTVRASIFWQTEGGALMEQQSLSTQVEFPSSIEVLVFYPPPHQALVKAASSSYAVGMVLLYVDLDGDRRFDDGQDRFVGGDTRNGFLYSPAQASAEASPTGTALAAGFSLVNLTTLCNWRRAQTGQDPLPDYPRCRTGRVCDQGYVCRAATRVCTPSPSVSCTPIGGSCDGGLVCEEAGPGCFPAAPSYADVCVKSACPGDQSCEDLLRCMPDTQEAGVACGPTIGCPARMVCDHATRTCTPLVPFSVELRDHIDLGRLSCAVP